jgi:hypothetical protein
VTDDQLRAEFEAMRGMDARDVPAFDRVLSRRVEHGTMRPPWSVLASAVAAVLVAGVLVMRARRPDDLVVPQEVLALSTWTAPTDVLLVGARMHLVTQAPALGASMVDTLRGRLR